jgi:hypothetical protein
MDELNDFIKDQIQRIFNNQKMDEISENYSATFLSGNIDDLPQEVEAEWLQYIKEFEEQFENSIEIPLHEFIGSPTLKPIDDIPTLELENEYIHVEMLLNENDVYVNFPDNLDIRTKYKFVTEELMNEAIENIQIQGMSLVFDYEELHPYEYYN